MPDTTNSMIPVERIKQCIYLIRGHKVLPDRDLAQLYGVETKLLNRAVSRNIDRFHEDFMFKLNRKEFENLRFHFGTSSWGCHRYPPRAFTEQGVAMLSSVLRSKRSSPTLVLDLHNDWMKSIPYTVLDPNPGSAHKKAYEYTKKVAGESGFLFVQEIEEVKGSFSYSLLEHDIPALTIELGESYVVNEKNVEYGVKSIMRILAFGVF